MAISFQCTCGRNLRVKDELAGRQARCPGCSNILTVPNPDAQYYAGEVHFADTSGDTHEKHEEHVQAEVPAPPRLADREMYPAPRPVKKRRLSSKRERKKERWRLPIIFINYEVAIGFVMIVAAIIWFVGALLWFGVIFYYPPILLILGIAAIYKGFSAPD